MQLIGIKSSDLTKATINRIKSHGADWEKIFVIHLSNKGISREKHLDEHTIGCPPSFVILRMQRTSTMRRYCGSQLGGWCGVSGILIHSWWDNALSPKLWENGRQEKLTLNMHPPFNPGNMFPGAHARDRCHYFTRHVEVRPH